MTGLRLGLGIIMVLLAGMACADEKNVRLVEAQQFAQGNKVAVIVGVNTYDQESGLRPLKYAAADAQGLKQALEKHGYIVRLLTNQKATKSYILDAIKQAGEALNSQGTLIFAFSGHGFAQNNANYLASYGTVSSDLSASALTMSELEQAVRNTRARRAVLFIDACRENPGIEGSRSIGQPSFIQQQSEGIQVLYATKFGDISWETPKLGHGVFSYFLQQALNGAAVDSDGAISFDNLKSYVQLHVANWTFENLARTQKPFSTGENYGVFMLASASGSLAPQLEPTPAPPPTPVPVARPEPEPVQPESVIAPVPASPKSFEPQMVNIPAGSFNMGCVESRDNVEGGCEDHEKPAHTVTLNTFQMGKYEVTFDEWDACEQAGVCPHAGDEGWGRGKHPVINVSWNDSQTYIKWLNTQTGKHYRLPTEAEWEYAARGTVNTAYPWGNTINCNNANVAYCDEGTTKNIGLYTANSYGLHDIIGNVWEWNADCWQSNYQGVSTDGSERKNCSTGKQGAVVRGGSWRAGQGMRFAARSRAEVNVQSPDLGFRLALDH